MSNTRDWRKRAQCISLKPDLFYPISYTRGEQVEKARAVCSSCPVKKQCREEVDQLEQKHVSAHTCYGIWAGETPRERIRRRKGKSAPTKLKLFKNPCKNCKTPLHSLIQHPHKTSTSMPHVAHGLCGNCYMKSLHKKARQKVKQESIRHPKFPHCLQCKKPMATYRTKDINLPRGHVRYTAKGMCQACYHKQKRQERKERS